MEEIILTITKYSIIMICCLYGYLKLSRMKFNLMNLLDFIFVVILSICLYYATRQIRLLIPLGIILTTFLFSLFRYRHSVLNTLITSVISCGIAIVIMVIAPLISIPFEYLAYKFIANDIVKNCVVTALICIIQIILTILIYRIKRFKSGINLKINDGTVEILLLISILSIFLLTLFYTDNIANSPTEIIIITLLFCGLGLIVWWKKHISNTYHKHVYKRNEALYEQRIEEYDKERLELLSQNDALAKIIHRDNKLLPAMIEAVNNLIKHSENVEELKPLLNQLESLSAERQTIISTYQSNTDTLPKTNIIALDAVLHYLYNKAQQNNVKFEISINNNCLPVLISRITDMTELITIICDLGENAIIATKEKPNGTILLSFDLTEESIPSFSFYDNGDPFDKKVIANMGRRQITTHKEDGGNGIGLMTLFEILDKYNASYLLDENLENSNFTKRITISLDGLHDITVS